MILKSILQKQTSPRMTYERNRCRYTKYVSHNDLRIDRVIQNNVITSTDKWAKLNPIATAALS